jgi:hypothetical protein
MWLLSININIQNGRNTTSSEALHPHSTIPSVYPKLSYVAMFRPIHNSDSGINPKTDQVTKLNIQHKRRIIYHWWFEPKLSESSNNHNSQETNHLNKKKLLVQKEYLTHSDNQNRRCIATKLHITKIVNKWRTWERRCPRFVNLDGKLKIEKTPKVCMRQQRP